MQYKPTRPIGFAGKQAPQRSASGFSQAPKKQYAPRPEQQQQQQQQFQAQPVQQAQPAPTQQAGTMPWDSTNQEWNTWLNEPWNPSRFAEWAPYKMLAQLQNLSDASVQNMYQSMPAYQAARQRASDANGPGGAQSLLDYFRMMQQGGVQEKGRNIEAMLRSQGIDAGPSAMLDAQNQAASATNDYSTDLYSPEKITQRAMTQMQLNSPDATNPLMSWILQLSNPAMQRTQTNNAEHAARAANSGLGALGQVLGMVGGFGKPAGGGGGGGAGFSNAELGLPGGAAPSAPSMPGLSADVMSYAPQSMQAPTSSPVGNRYIESAVANGGMYPGEQPLDPNDPEWLQFQQWQQSQGGGMPQGDLIGLLQYLMNQQ